MNEQQKIRINELVFKSLEEIISEQECAELNALLESDPQSLKYYSSSVDFNLGMKKIAKYNTDSFQLGMLLEDMAEYEKTAPAIDIPKPSPKQDLIQKVVYEKTPSQINKFSLFSGIISAAAVLFIVLFMKFTSPVPTSVEVATLKDQMQVKWGQSNSPLNSNERLWTGQGLLDLKEGIVKICYDDGVNVLIEGPAMFEIERSGLFLEYGRVYSRVPETGLGFTIQTPTSRFIDHGTEFGIQADVNGSSELHVIQGKVQLFAGSKGHSKAGQLVTKNNAVSYNANNDRVQKIRVQNDAFVRQINSKTRTVWRGQTSVSLSDIVGGGNGFGTGTAGAGINPTTGQIVDDSELITPKEERKAFSLVPDNPFVDCVFYPGWQSTITRITSTGETLSPSCQVGSSGLDMSITNASYNFSDHPGDWRKSNLKINGVPVATLERPALSIHANSGITFDLQAIRQSLPELNITELKMLISPPDKNRDEVHMNVYVLLDNKPLYVKEDYSGQDPPVSLAVPIPEYSRFLTFVVTKGIDYGTWDWCLFTDTQLLLMPEKSNE